MKVPPRAIQVHAAGSSEQAKCNGFITLLQPRDPGIPAVEVAVFEEEANGAATVEVVGAVRTTYLLGSREGSAQKDRLVGLAAVMKWSKDTAVLQALNLLHGSELQLSCGVRVSSSINATFLIRRAAPDQYHFALQGSASARIDLSLPWSAPPKQVRPVLPQIESTK
jgi:hypothetical protein